MPVWDSWGLNLGQQQGRGGGLGLQNLSQLAGLRPFGDRAGVQRATVAGAQAPATAAPGATSVSTTTDPGLPRPITNGPQHALAHTFPAPVGTPPAGWVDPRTAALTAAAARVPTMTGGRVPRERNLADFAPRAPVDREALRAAHEEQRQARSPERQPPAPRGVPIPRKDQETNTPIGQGPVVNGTATYSPAQLAALQAQTQNMAMADRNRWLETAQAIMGGQLTGEAAIQAIQQLTGTDRAAAAQIVAGLPSVAQVTVGLPGQAVTWVGGPDEVGFGVGGAGLAGLPGASGSPQIEWAPDWTHYMQPSLGR